MTRNVACRKDCRTGTPTGRCSSLGAYLVPKANAKPEELLKFAYTLEGGDWQDINVDLPNKGGAAILRIYLPHASEPVDIDWINVKPEPGKSTRWDF